MPKMHTREKISVNDAGKTYQEIDFLSLTLPKNKPTQNKTKTST